MQSQPYWIDIDPRGRLAIAPRPRGGDWLTDELANMRRDGVDILASLLTDQEAEDLGLAKEAEAAPQSGITFHSFAILDRSTPKSSAHFRSLIDSLASERRAGRNVAAHCRAGIGRSSLLIAGILCVEGFSPEDALNRISAARGIKVPDTDGQVTWLLQFAQELRA